MNASETQRLTRCEIRYVTTKVVEVFKALHEDGYVHTGLLASGLCVCKGTPSSNRGSTVDIKPDNVLVNYTQGDIRFAEVELADCGSTVPNDSAYAKDHDMIGASVWRSPEAMLQIGWDTPTDIGSLGTMASFKSHRCLRPNLFLINTSANIKAPSRWRRL